MKENPYYLNTITPSTATCYVINSSAIGDTIAALGSLKYAIENFHKDGRYHILRHKQFKDLYMHPSFDQSKITDFETHTQFKEPYAFKQLNEVNGKALRLHPLRVSLIDYGSIALLTRILPDEHKNYIPFVVPADVSRFNIPFEKAVVVSITSSTPVRKIPDNEVQKICNMLLDLGYIPVIVGKTQSSFKVNWSAIRPTKGIDLINQTSLAELYHIIDKSVAIIGLDNGVMHISGMSPNARIVYGTTIVHPELRMPYRNNICGWRCEPVLPDTPCSLCQSKWQLDNFDFTKCYFNNYACTSTMTAEKFIEAFKKVLTHK